MSNSYVMRGSVSGFDLVSLFKDVVSDNVTSSPSSIVSLNKRNGMVIILEGTDLQKYNSGAAILNPTFYSGLVNKISVTSVGSVIGTFDLGIPLSLGNIAHSQSYIPSGGMNSMFAVVYTDVLPLILKGDDIGKVQSSGSLTGLDGNDTLYGSAGTDIAIFRGVAKEYSVQRHELGYTVIDKAEGRDGVDVLVDIEHIQFADRTMLLQQGTAPQYSGFAPLVGGWSDMTSYPRAFADVNGDGLVDVVGFGYSATYVALGTGDGRGTFGPAQVGIEAYGFGPEGGFWVSQSRYPRHLADVNGDGRADIVGFGDAAVYVSLGQSDGTFKGFQTGVAAFGAGAPGGHWLSQERYHRELGDVNGDGRADVVGFGGAGVYIALGQADGTFSSPTFALSGFGADPAGGSWFSDDRYPRRLGDIDGDGDDDIIGFGDAGVYVAISNGNGTFGAVHQVSNSFGASVASGGWSSQNEFSRQLADIDGDGADDIVGFGGAGAYVAFSQKHGTFSDLSLISTDLGGDPQAGAWANETITPRFAVDFNNDGLADIAGIGHAGVYILITDNGALIG